MSDIHVDPNELRRHAQNVMAASEGIGAGASAAEATAMNGEAFGLLIAFVGNWFQGQEAELAQSFRITSDGLHSGSCNLNRTARDCERAGKPSADRSTSAGKRLELSRWSRKPPRRR